MLFFKKTAAPIPQVDAAEPLRQIDPALFQHIAGGSVASTDAPKNGWLQPDAEPSELLAPKNGW